MPWETDLRTHWYDLCQRLFCPCSLLGVLCCYVLFNSLSPFEFISVHGVRMCSNFIDLHAAVQLSQYHLLKRLFPILYSCLLCQMLTDCRCVFIYGSLFLSIDLYVCSISVPHILITVALWYCPKSGRNILLFCFFYLRIALPILGFMIPYIILDYLF